MTGISFPNLLHIPYTSHSSLRNLIFKIHLPTNFQRTVKDQRAMAPQSAPAILSVLSVIVATSMITIGSLCNSIEAHSYGSGELSGQREFDYFALALQWPGTFCRRTRHCCSNNACCRGSNAPTEFTIHGLWPDYNDGTWPACCTDSRFDPKELAPLQDSLDKYWPSLSCGSPSSCHGGKGSFWGHEWEKHGTCSSPVAHDIYSYFLITLNVYFKYNVTKVLNEAGYVPSNTEKYPLGGIVSAIQNAFHATPQLICSKGAVEELRLCFYKDFKPRDCVIGSSNQYDIYSSKSSCPSYVSLPAYVSSGLQNVEGAALETTGAEAM